MSRKAITTRQYLLNRLKGVRRCLRRLNQLPSHLRNDWWEGNLVYYREEEAHLTKIWELTYGKAEKLRKAAAAGSVSQGRQHSP
jgi:hypothetical protein